MCNNNVITVLEVYLGDPKLDGQIVTHHARGSERKCVIMVTR